MDRIVILSGMASTIGGICIFFYQALMYLMNNTWTQYSVMFLIERGPASLWDFAAANPNIANMLESCPLSAFFVVLGLVLLLAGSKLKNRFS